MTEDEWRSCGEPGRMLNFLEEEAFRRVGLNRARSRARRVALFQTAARPDARKRRLLAAACCRRLWHLLGDARLRSAVEVAERYADGLATDEELARADEAATTARRGIAAGRGGLCDAAEAVREATDAEVTGFIKGCPYAYNACGCDEAATLVEEHAQADLVRCVFGNPFRPASLDPACLTPDVLALARAAYENRQLPSGHLDPQRLSVLADALEEAGGASADVLGHLRSPGPHARGCWAVDLVLGWG